MNTNDRTDGTTLAAPLAAQLRTAGLTESRLTIASASAVGLCEAATGLPDETTVTEAVRAFQHLYETVAGKGSK